MDYDTSRNVPTGSGGNCGEHFSLTVLLSVTLAALIVYYVSALLWTVLRV
jgi:hypothetical protein